jgi:hypothetical protein
VQSAKSEDETKVATGVTGLSHEEQMVICERKMAPPGTVLKTTDIRYVAFPGLDWEPVCNYFEKADADVLPDGRIVPYPLACNKTVCVS